MKLKQKISGANFGDRVKQMTEWPIDMKNEIKGIQETSEDEMILKNEQQVAAWIATNHL